MLRTIYIANLPYSSTEQDVYELFRTFTRVHSVKLIQDRETKRPKGYGFVEVNEEGLEAAIEALNGSLYGGRTLTVSEAKQRTPRRRFSLQNRLNNQ
jgi:RNA recognition motif-containing protein